MKRGGPRLTRHAAARSQSRAISGEVIELVLDHANIERNVGGGVISAMVTRRRIAALKAVPRPIREKMEGVVVLYAVDDGSVVSVMHAHGPTARRYLHH